jgi:hypothetical protein
LVCERTIFLKRIIKKQSHGGHVGGHVGNKKADEEKMSINMAAMTSHGNENLKIKKYC